MSDWSRLNARGRCMARGHYRRLREGGLERHLARMVTNAVVFGIEMADRFGPYTGDDTVQVNVG